MLQLVGVYIGYCSLFLCIFVPFLGIRNISFITLAIAVVVFEHFLLVFINNFTYFLLGKMWIDGWMHGRINHTANEISKYKII